MAGGGKFDILLVLSGGAAATLDRVTGATGDAADVRSALAALKPWRGAAVLIATDAVFQQTIRLPFAQTEGLSPQELESALFYEIEPFCGLRREEAVLASSRLPGGEWAVAAVNAAEFGHLRADVEAARCRLAGVVALPKGTNSSPNAALAALFPDNAPPAPVIVPPHSSPLHSRNFASVFVILLALLSLGCLFDWLWLSARVRRVRPRLAASETAAAANDRILSEIRADERRIGEIDGARLHREESARALAAARDAWLSLLSTLGAESSDDFALLAIAPGEDCGATVQCVAPSAGAAADVLARLSAALAPHGWALRPGALREGGTGLASFSFDLARSQKEAQEP